jgi:hypothetical protein
VYVEIHGESLASPQLFQLLALWKQRGVTLNCRFVGENSQHCCYFNSLSFGVVCYPVVGNQHIYCMYSFDSCYKRVIFW